MGPQVILLCLPQTKLAIFSYKGLKSKIRKKRSNIWSSKEHLEQIIKKYDLEYQRFENGLDISN